MMLWVHSVRLRAAFIVLAVLLAGPAWAELPTTITISDPQGELADVPASRSAVGVAAALGRSPAHYEDAVRQHPKDLSLHQRFDVARLHYDLDRRYADRSFCESFARLPSDGPESL